MQSINFEEGYKEFCINDDESRVIRFNPADTGLLERFNAARNNILKAVEKIDSDVVIKANGEPEDELESSAELIAKTNKVIKDQMDYIFNADVSGAAFGNQSPISTVKGKFLFEGFIEAIGKIIGVEVKAEQLASQKRISKYTKQVHR